MKFLTENSVYNITAKEWTGEGYKPDCFGDIAANETIDMAYNTELDAWETTEERMTEIIEWWEEEFENWSQGFSDAGEKFDPINITLFVDKEER